MMVVSFMFRCCEVSTTKGVEDKKPPLEEIGLLLLWKEISFYQRLSRVISRENLQSSTKVEGPAGVVQDNEP